MSKKKSEKKEKKILKCPHCESTDAQWWIRGSAVIHWEVGTSDDAVDSDGTINPEDGVDWDNVSFSEQYDLQCGDCEQYFDIPEGFKLQPGWG